MLPSSPLSFAHRHRHIAADAIHRFTACAVAFTAGHPSPARSPARSPGSLRWPLPGQQGDHLLANLGQLCAQRLEHLSGYALTLPINLRSSALC